MSPGVWLSCQILPHLTCAGGGTYRHNVPSVVSNSRLRLSPSLLAWHRRAGTEGRPKSDELALHGVHYSLKTIVSPQLLVDAVKVIAQSLKADL